MKKNIAVITLLFVTFLIFPEKWVGQVATYNLIEGSVTSDGQVFDPNNMSAACNGFRLGAKVKVINVKTGKQIEVLVNDRIKNNSNYFILLSPKAANELGLPWETSLVVIDAKFSDVNSTEILPISGLVAEGTVDRENLKKFPDINWPNGDKSISKLTEEKPIDDKQKKPDIKDNVKLDTDTSEKEKLPNIESGKTPKKIMENYMLDEDVSEKLNPKNESIKKPVTKENNIDKDEDGKLTPQNDLLKQPDKNEKNLSEDKDDKLSPKNEIIKKPENKKNLIDTEEEFPKKITQVTPEKDKNLIDTDQSEKEIPYEELYKTPLTKEKFIDPDLDDKMFPKNEKVTQPEKDKLKIDEDKTMPKNDTVKSPEKDKVKISEDKNTVKVTKQTEKEGLPEKIEWITELPKGKIFIRFSATFEQIEGERRILLFKKVFQNIVGLKENGKFILLVGPVEKKDIDKILKGLRNFGYKDSYVIQK